MRRADSYSEVQCACWGYPTGTTSAGTIVRCADNCAEQAYYRDASSTDSLLANRTPLFAIHAEDDPVRDDEAPVLKLLLMLP